jgi:DNA repair protein RecO (recombination protein O)
MAGPSQQDQAYVLHTRRYRENSLLVEALTREHGRIGLVARTPGSGKRRREVLQAFRPMLAVWQGRGELYSLTHWEQTTAAPALLGERLLSGLYLNELVIRLAGRGEGDPRLFDSYATTIDLIAHGDALEPVLRAFEVALLEISGYGLEFETAVDAECPVTAGTRYVYQLDQGPFLTELRPGGIPVQGETLLALAGRQPLTPDVLPEAKRLMRAVLAHHLGDRPLHSRSLFGPAESD